MRKLLVATGLIAGSFVLTPHVEAQVRVGVNINIGEQPSWRSPAYDYVEYYYLPDIETYYYVPNHQFIYLSGGRWQFSSSLPARYRNYNLNSGYKVVINRPNAYNYYEQDRRRYVKRHNDYDNHTNNRHNKNHRDNGNHYGQRKHGRH